MADLEGLRLAVRRLPGGRGGEVGAGRAGGMAFDFHEHVPYAPGDDVRRVDWRRFARTGDLLVRTDLDRSGHAVHILVDRSGSMGLGNPPRLPYAVRLAAALAFAALQAGHPVGVAAFAGADGAVLPARAGMDWLGTVLRFLEGLRAAGATDLRAGLTAALAGRRGEGRVILVSDLVDPGPDPARPGDEGRRGGDEGRRGDTDDAQGPLARALELLAAGGRRRAADVVEVLADDEAAWPVGATVDAVDAETGERRTFTVTAEVAAAWSARLQADRAAAARTCRALGLVHVRATSADAPIAAVRELAAARA